MILGIPVINGPDLTKQCLDELDRSISDCDTKVVLFDNDGQGYNYIEDFVNDYYGGTMPEWLNIIRYHKNAGYYYPLLELSYVYDDEVIGLIHNDVFIYEHGWDKRVMEEFGKQEKLGVIGFCGSWEVDINGGRGGGTMCYFVGENGGQSQDAGLRITGLSPSVVLDSLAMFFKRDVIPCLNIDENIAICHFYDRIWPLRAIENGWRVATLGIRIDHMGGQTAVLDPEYHEKAKQWCEEQGLVIPEGSDANWAVYKEAERRYLMEYRNEKRIIPMSVDQEWNYFDRPDWSIGVSTS